MNVDVQTINDLKIVGDYSRGSPCVLQLVDRTRTQVGRKNLRRLLTAPYKTACEIRDAQQAHAFLAGHVDRVSELIEPTICDGVERYLRSEWAFPESTAGLSHLIDSYIAPLPKTYFHEVESGQFRILALLQAAAELHAELRAAPAPSLRALATKLAQLLESGVIHQLAAAGEGRARHSRIQFDDHARRVARATLIEMLECFGAADAMLSIGLATAEHGWCYPTFEDGLSIRGLHHPLLKDAAVPNDVVLGDSIRVALVSGPNMSGKSTFLQAIGVSVQLAQAGCGVPAKAMSFMPFQASFANLSINDNLARGESFYLSEVRRLRRLAETIIAVPRTLVLLDEPFRGTNTNDSLDATRGVISKLVSLPRSVAFVASHLSQVVSAFDGQPHVCALHFAANVKQKDILFDYTVRPGLSTQRIGMALLQQEQVLELLDAAAADGSSRI